jgi:hypothetical protein
MKKYLEDLRKELKENGINDFDIQDIINDLTEMIQEALSEGLDEGDIPKKFGNPEDLAKDLAKDQSKEKPGQETTDNGALFSGKDIQNIDVKLLNEDIHLLGTDGESFEVYGKNVDPKNYEIYEKENCLYLQRKNNLGLKFRIFRTSNEVFTIKVPKNQNLKSLSLSIKSSDGTIKHIKSDDLNIHSISGDFDLKEVNGQSSKMKSISGDVSIHQCQWDGLTISNVSGDYDISQTEINGNMRINTVSGDIDISESIAKDVDYNAVSGDLVAKEFYPASVSLKSVSGDIKFKNSDHSKTIEIVRKRSVSGDIEL